MATVYQRLHNPGKESWDFAVVRRKDAPPFPIVGSACKIKIDGEVLVINQESIPHWEVGPDTIATDKRTADVQHRIRLIDIVDVSYYVENKIILPKRIIT